MDSGVAAFVRWGRPLLVVLLLIMLLWMMVLMLLLRMLGMVMEGRMVVQHGTPATGGRRWRVGISRV